MDGRTMVMGLALLVVGVVVGSTLTAPPAQSQAGWHSCIAADLHKVDGNNTREMLEASGERRVMVPPGYEPVGGGYGTGDGDRAAIVILCRH